MTQTSKCCAGLGQLGARLSPALFKALSDPRRVEILTWLAESCGPRTVTEVAEACPVDVSVVSRHLAALREAGVVAAERRGRHVHYRVRYGELAAALRSIADAIEACCPVDGPPPHRPRPARQQKEEARP